MKNYYGLNLLRSRPIEKPFDSQGYENSIGIKLPPIYKLFLESYYMDNLLASGQKWEGLKISELLVEDGNRFTIITKLENTIYNDDLILTPPEISLEVFRELSDDAALFFEHGEIDCFPIGAGNGVNSPGIYVGIKAYNLDKIYLENSGIRRGKWTLLANNIFEFIRGFEVVEYTEEECKKYQFTYDRLYKNWGEDFWRVREE